jgi:hypothetical protein
MKRKMHKGFAVTDFERAPTALLLQLKEENGDKFGRK